MAGETGESTSTFFSNQHCRPPGGHGDSPDMDSKDPRSIKVAILNAMIEHGAKKRRPYCRLWALYRKSLRLFLLGDLTKPELDAVVIYTIGDDNGKPH